MTKAQRAPRANEFRFSLIIPKPIWKKLALIAGSTNKKIQDVASDIINAHFTALPSELQPRCMSGGRPPFDGWEQFYRSLVPGVKEQIANTPPPPPPDPFADFTLEQRTELLSAAERMFAPIPLPPIPTWSEIWPRIYDKLHVPENWEEFQTRLNGVTPPAELLSYPFDQQILWLKTYAPIS